jgi:hypothetical protein
MLLGLMFTAVDERNAVIARSWVKGTITGITRFFEEPLFMLKLHERERPEAGAHSGGRIPNVTGPEKRTERLAVVGSPVGPLAAVTLNTACAPTGTGSWVPG